MKKMETDDQWLDDLLAKPLTIADQGFVNRVQAQLYRKRVKRKTIFAGAACAWLAVALVFVSPQSVSSIYQRLLSLAAFTDQLILVPGQVNLIDLISLQSNMLLALLLALGFYALLYTQFKE